MITNRKVNSYIFGGKVETFNNYYDMCVDFKYIYLNGFKKLHNLNADIVGVINYFGSTGTSKDYVAYNMLKYAKENHKLKGGMPVVDYSGGSFGMALTIAALSMGHPAHLVVPQTLPEERSKLLKTLGANLHFAPEKSTASEKLQYTAALAQKIGGYFVDFVNNDDNPEVHRRITGPQILKVAGEDFNFLVTGIGSGGTVSGTGEYVKAWTNGISIIGVQPFESQVLTGGIYSPHGLNDIGLPLIPGNYNPYIVDDIVSVATSAARKCATEVLYTDGLPLSVGAGAVLTAAKEIALKPENEGKLILAILSSKRHL